MFLLQERVFLIPLADVQSMRTIRPKRQGKMPAVEINYGNPGHPKTITFHLKQVTTVVATCDRTIQDFYDLGLNFLLLATVSGPKKVVLLWRRHERNSHHGTIQILILFITYTSNRKA